jgi:type I restriction-modification system, S subunit
MKESGIDWIGQIPEEWESGKVKYFSKISAGATPDRNNLLFWNGKINWMSSGEVNQEIVKYTAETITNLALKKSSTKLLPIGTVMLAMNGQGKTKGTVAILAVETASNQSLASFIVDGNRLNNQYLYYFFKAGYSYIRGLKGEDRDGLNLQLVSNITVLLFDIKEQQKIADFLDKKTAQLDKVKNLLEEQIQKLKDYRASLIYETVTKGLDKTVPMKDSGIDWIGQVPQGWGVSRLKYLTNKIGSGKTPLGGSEIFEETGILFIRSQNIYNGLILLEDKATYINRNIHQQMIGTCVKKNDILLNITGASIGRVAKYDLDIEANVNQHVCIIRSNRHILPDYLMYFIMSEFGQFMIKTHQISGNREGLSFENIGNFKIIAPELDYQYEISQYLNKKMLTINQMIKTKEQQIANINKQRQTLIYDYVTGKRRV